jgi:CO dehydrogenase nickel-insertion accessory protein CooC1
MRMAKVHLTIGAKGGIGKSFIAALMAQYLVDNVVDCKPLCIDLDFKNRVRQM